MKPALVSARIRVRPVDSGHILPRTSYMNLHYHPAEPYEVWLEDPGMGELVFARDLLTAALHPHRSQEQTAVGSVSLQLTCFGTESLILLATHEAPEQQFVLSARAAAAFLAQTYDLVPAGSEENFLDLDSEIEGLLRSAA